MKKYWLVKPEYYDRINELTNAKFAIYIINYFKKYHKKGVYIMINNNMDKKEYYSHMPYPYYREMDGKICSSAEWLNEEKFLYCGEISRKEKLKKIYNE